jgi:hypothetical protein
LNVLGGGREEGLRLGICQIGGEGGASSRARSLWVMEKERGLAVGGFLRTLAEVRLSEKLRCFEDVAAYKGRLAGA